MFRSKLMIPALSAVCLLASQAVVPSVAMAASPLRAIVAQSPAGAKMVKLNLTNSSAAPLDLKVGETAVTLAAGETVKLSAPEGAKIVVATATSTREAGAVIAQVSRDLSDANIRIN